MHELKRMVRYAMNKQFAIGAVTALGLFFVIKYIIEPWVIETVCRELVRCN